MYEFKQLDGRFCMTSKWVGIEHQIFTAILLFSTNILYLLDVYSILKLAEFVSVSMILFISLWFICFLVSFSKLLFLSVIFLLFILSSFINYYKYYYKIIISSSLVESVLATNTNEVSELFNLSLLIWMALFIILPCILIIWVMKCNLPKISKKVYFSILIIAISSALIILPNKSYKLRYISNSLCSFMPFNFILTAKNYWLFHNNKELRNNINKHFDFSRKDKDHINVVLVIGESARSDHFNINGYKRNTTPNLSKIKNLITYPHAYSLATNTVMGVQRIMQKDNRGDLSSFIQAFNGLGFDTYWFSNQDARYSMINEIVKEANSYLLSDDIRFAKTGNNYDMDLLPYVQKIINQNKHNLIILHTIGSHRLYDLRYPESFRKFKPTCLNNELYYSVNECRDLEKLNNSYDNSILYTDYFLSELIKILDKNNAILIYLSDHGESLGENGIYAHATPLESAPIEQIHIPFFVWMSNSLLSKQDYQIFFNNIKSNISLKIDQSYVFHSIMDCAGITSESIDKDKSICKSHN